MVALPAVDEKSPPAPTHLQFILQGNHREDLDQLHLCVVCTASDWWQVRRVVRTAEKKKSLVSLSFPPFRTSDQGAACLKLVQFLNMIHFPSRFSANLEVLFILVITIIYYLCYHVLLNLFSSMRFVCAALSCGNVIFSCALVQ